MLDSRTTLSKVCELLATLPHVRVVEEQLSSSSARIELIVASGKSMHTLQRLCMGANVELEPWARLSGPEESAGLFPSTSCTLLASILSRDSIELGSLQLLGIHLAWALHKAGALPSSVANQLLQQWHGAASIGQLASPSLPVYRLGTRSGH